MSDGITDSLPVCDLCDSRMYNESPVVVFGLDRVVTGSVCTTCGLKIIDAMNTQVRHVWKAEADIRKAAWQQHLEAEKEKEKLQASGMESMRRAEAAEAEHDILRTRIERLEWLLEVEAIHYERASSWWTNILLSVHDLLGNAIARNCLVDLKFEYDATLTEAKSAVEG